MPATLLQKRTSSLADRQELGQIVYCVAIALLLILSEVFSSSIQNTLPAFSRFARMALSGASLGLLGIKCLFLTRYESLVQWVILVAAGLYAAFAGAHGGDTWFLLAVLVGPELLSLMMDSRMEDGHLFHQGDSVRVQLFLRGITDFCITPCLASASSASTTVTSSPVWRGAWCSTTTASPRSWAAWVWWALPPTAC